MYVLMYVSMQLWFFPQQVEVFHNLSKEITSLPSVVYFDMIRLDCEDLKQGLAKKAQTLAQNLVARLITTHREQCLQ